IDVLGAGLREDAERVPVRRAGALERLAAGRVDPLAVDVVLEALRPRQCHGGQSIQPASSGVSGNVPGIRGRRRSRISRFSLNSAGSWPLRRSSFRRSMMTVTFGLSL